MADCILKTRSVKDEVIHLRRRFLDMQYCFTGSEANELTRKLQALI
jgi:primosomal replication protein N